MIILGVFVCLFAFALFLIGSLYDIWIRNGAPCRLHKCVK